jgi:murein DD-endopeptidase MepM/ murein hydrolase activator NlpD
MRANQLNKFFIASLILLIAILALGPSSLVSAEADEKEEIEKLNQEVDDKKTTLETLNAQISAYQKKIIAKQAQIISLKDQMVVIENRIAKAELDIQLVKTEIESINAELKLLERQIGDKEDEINLQKETLSKLIRRLNKLDDRSYLEVLLANDSFSEFFDQLKHLEDIQSDLQGSLDEIQTLKSGLEEKQALRESKKTQLSETKEKLIQQKDELDEEINLKEILVTDSENSEQMYQQLMTDLQQERQYIDSQVMALEDTIRSKIEAMDEAFASGGGETVLSWPASPARGITAYFHDPTYPFRHLFEHSGIDLRLYQGTPIKSSAPGYVVWAKQGRSYGNFVMILHADGISTVYAHLSKINVKVDQFVERGQTIGLSGGMPGTPGAGLSTGPHLHFEVRESGIPVNPLNYLIEP